MFIYQSTFSTLELKEYRITKYVISWKSKGVFISTLAPLYTAFLHNIKLSAYRIRTQFNKSVLVLEQNNYLTKIVNVYVVYDYADWPKSFQII